MKQRLTLGKGSTQSGRTRHQNCDVAVEASGDRA